MDALMEMKAQTKARRLNSSITAPLEDLGVAFAFSDDHSTSGSILTPHGVPMVKPSSSGEEQKGPSQEQLGIYAVEDCADALTSLFGSWSLTGTLTAAFQLLPTLSNMN